MAAQPGCLYTVVVGESFHSPAPRSPRALGEPQTTQRANLARCEHQSRQRWVSKRELGRDFAPQRSVQIDGLSKERTSCTFKICRTCQTGSQRPRVLWRSRKSLAEKETSGLLYLCTGQPHPGLAFKSKVFNLSYSAQTPEFDPISSCKPRISTERFTLEVQVQYIVPQNLLLCLLLQLVNLPTSTQKAHLEAKVTLFNPRCSQRWPVWDPMLLHLLPAALTAQVGSLLSFTSGQEHVILFFHCMMCHIFILNPHVQL